MLHGETGRKNPKDKIHGYETHGYVVRARSEEDGRGTSVFLTETGHSLRPVLDRISLCLERYINARLSDQEALQLEKLLRKLLGDSIPLPSASDSADDRAKPLEVRN